MLRGFVTVHRDIMLDTDRCLSWTSSIHVQIYQWRNSAANTTEDIKST
jgi:hypothetical protein